MTRYDTISFLSDFGHDDEFVGVVKSVLRSLAPHATVVDLSHGVPAFDVRAGSLALARSVQYLAPGVILAVVDPGVGTDRRAVAVEVAGGEGVFVGPDNGLLAGAVAMAGGAERAVALTNPEYQLVAPGATFAARDIFGPAAAHLANGVPLDELGEVVDTASLLPGVLPLTRREGETVVCEVLWVDRYGNAQLNLDPDELDLPSGHATLRFGGSMRRARRVGAYGDIPSGEVGLVVDSYGLYSISFDRAAAATMLGLTVGTEVIVEPGDAPAVSTPVTLRTDGSPR
jgi:S-adenosylmethionine hydrolase